MNEDIPKFCSTHKQVYLRGNYDMSVLSAMIEGFLMPDVGACDLAVFQEHHRNLKVKFCMSPEGCQKQVIMK